MESSIYYALKGKIYLGHITIPAIATEDESSKEFTVSDTTKAPAISFIPDIGRYNIIDILSYHCITFSRIAIFLYYFLTTGDIFVI
jgi:hypothetical protein